MSPEGELSDGVSGSTRSSARPSTRGAGKGRQKAGESRRFVGKDGRCHATFRQPPGEWGLYMTDIFTTLVEIRWRVMLLVFSLSYILSWLFFGLLYWVIALAHGDLSQPGNPPCVENVRSFTAAFLFSMETQATIGYGFRGMTENCAEAITVVTVQDVLSCLIDAAVIGVVAAKMASARKRAQTVGFSRVAVVSERDGQACLSWRLGDFRGNHLLEGVAQAQLIRRRLRPSGGVALSYQDLEVQSEHILLAAPATIVHRLGRGSPLWGLGPEDLRKEDFELVVTFTYTGDSTGVLHQTRTSYTPAEILWGHRFQDVLKVGRTHYRVDYSLFHQTVTTASGSGVNGGTNERTLHLPSTELQATSTYQEAWL
ncbi:inward rectifier potassium channel 16-like [Megalops cyprinoides]|uniref:inward rectifier potassium channel 16-like n=1 Tax=Megalops cyprinoides TaxID=118141 RepID=UPI001863DD73|nr:inward rectifier potassium channel 16-like [Megalops cyprinoides]